jgi:hypothetical protein
LKVDIYNFDSIKPDIIIGTETWLDKDIKDSEICPKGYILHRKDRNSKNQRTGGGVLLAMVFSFQFHPGKFMSPPMINIALFIVLALVTDVSTIVLEEEYF